MKNLIEYDPPLAEGIADDHDTDSDSCSSVTDPPQRSYWCTRKVDHAGRHEGAGPYNQVYASWEDDE